MITGQQKLDFNNFLYDYYYSNHANAKKWDIENDIFSALPNEKRRIIIDYNAMQDFDGENNTNISVVLKNANIEETIHDLRAELNFEKDVDIEEPTKQYRYSLKKWNYPTSQDDTDPIQYQNIKLDIGFKNTPLIMNIADATKTQMWSKLVVVHGMIQNVGIPKTIIKSKRFECEKCGYFEMENFLVLQQKHKTKTMKYCPYCNATRRFKVTKEEVERVQLLVLSEKVSTSMPYTLKVVIPEDLIDESEPDDRRIISGSEMTLVGLIDGYTLPNSLVKIPLLKVLFWKLDEEEIKITPEDIKIIEKLSKRKSLIDLLVKSFSPSIYGHEKVKEALILSCVGGNHKYSKEDKKLKRGSIHILLCGDPSTSKSTLGMFIYNYMRKSRYSVCSELSHAGLGVALLKDPETDTWLISSGVLPLAHKSLAILDELDKADPDDIKSLNVVMEMQILPMDKAGTSVKLPAQTTVIGIANPKMSRFDPYTDLKEQISFDEVLLSRFDLKFAFIDVPDEKIDKKICKKIIGETGSNDTPMTSEFLFKYIMYAKKFTPKLSKKTYDVLEKYYIKLRNQSGGKGGILQITPRQFDGLIRITEAYAKLRLDKNTIKKDGERAIKLFEHYLQSFGFNPETGKVEIDRADGRTTKKTRDKNNRMLEILKGLQKLMKIVPKDDFFKGCSNEFTSTDVEKFLRKAKEEGWVFEPKPRMYQVA